MNGSPSPETGPALLRRKTVLIPVIILAVILGTWAWVRTTYPYGPSDCQTEVIGAALLTYATNHGGWFPHGGATPEASLSLVCQANTNLLPLVRGKTIPLKIAQAAWAKDGQLGPDSCGWNYVDGLRLGDDPKLGLVWDKAFGLDHFGERQHGLAHEVIYADGSPGVVSLEKWPDFVRSERAKLDELMASRASNGIFIRWSDVDFLGTNQPTR